MPSHANNRSLSTPVLGLIWFGASVSLAEILTGTFFAPLGLELGLAAILLGHVIGGALIALVAYVSAKTGTSAMGAAARSFGRAGAGAFSIANVIQLVGWTAIMVASGGLAASLLAPSIGFAPWCGIIGALIVAWIAIGVKRMGKVQSIAAALLFALTVIVSFTVFESSQATFPVEESTLTFGAAVELAVAMPLSWLPVVGDYVREAKSPKAGVAASTALYFIGSCWMFVIGLGCALFAGSNDIATVLGASGMGIVGLLVVVFSTVTTTFLDAQSAGVSAKGIKSSLDERAVGIAAAIVGTVLAIFAPVNDFEGFLYLIGSVFAPMAAIVCVDFFILHRDASSSKVDVRNIVLWVCGFALYRLSLAWDLPCGNTLPVMVIIAIVAIAVDALAKTRARSLANEAN